jgi:hypothetical protein
MNKTLVVGNRTLVAAGALLAELSVPLTQQTSGGAPAVIANDMRNSFELPLDHLGGKMGSLPTQVTTRTISRGRK